MKRIHGERTRAASRLQCTWRSRRRPPASRSPSMRKTRTTPAAAADEVVVLGRGETRQVQTVTAQQIEQLPAGTSPLKAIENMPGVNFQAADPYGTYEWSTRITVRGFNQNRLGFTLDGVPLGDMTYGNHNGLHISRAIPTELVDRVVLSQGTGTLATASASNLGGAIEFFSAAPASEFNIDAAQTFGSDSARRTFVKVDTGELGARHPRSPSPRPTTPRRSGKAPATRTFGSTTSSSRSRSAKASSRCSTTTRTAWRSTTRISRRTSSRAAATSGTTGTRTGLAQSPPRMRATRAGKTTPSPATTRTGTRRACGKTTSATWRSICRSATRSRGRRRRMGIATTARDSGARRTRRRRAVRRSRFARRNTTSAAKAS